MGYGFLTMIIHRREDGSEGYQYEVGDKVEVSRTIQGGWFDIGPTSAEFCTIRRLNHKDPWRIQKVELHYSDEWGWAHCFPWMLSPTAQTLSAAKVVSA